MTLPFVAQLDCQWWYVSSYTTPSTLFFKEVGTTALRRNCFLHGINDISPHVYVVGNFLWTVAQVFRRRNIVFLYDLHVAP